MFFFLFLFVCLFVWFVCLFVDTLLVAQATNLEDFEEEARLYSLVQQDPRYVRWLRKLCPKLISTQKLRSLVDPSSIPMVGIGVNLYRAQDTYGHKSQLQKFEGGVSFHHFHWSLYSLLSY